VSRVIVVSTVSDDWVPTQGDVPLVDFILEGHHADDRCNLCREQSKSESESRHLLAYGAGRSESGEADAAAWLPAASCLRPGLWHMETSGACKFFWSRILGAPRQAALNGGPVWAAVSGLTWPWP
jgi:hypothetical protein